MKFHLVELQIDKAKTEKSDDFLLNGLLYDEDESEEEEEEDDTKKNTMLYYNYWVDQAVQFGASRWTAKSEMIDVFNFSYKLRKVRWLRTNLSFLKLKLHLFSWR